MKRNQVLGIVLGTATVKSGNISLLFVYPLNTLRDVGAIVKRAESDADYSNSCVAKFVAHQYKRKRKQTAITAHPQVVVLGLRVRNKLARGEETRATA